VTVTASFDGLLAARLPLPARDQRRIARRWESYYRGWCGMEAARRGHRGAFTLDGYERIHRDAARQCLAAGITWAAIERAGLDDPRMSEDERTREICAASERRRTRMGRVKGVTRRHR
jgi:hypothetical protein